MDSECLNSLVKVLSYPDENLARNTKSLLESIEREDEEVYQALEYFLSEVEKEDVQRLREIYTTTFDLKAMACMDVGYVLFGEDYKRGAFLVEIQRLMRENNIDSGAELPDHLPNMLKLMKVMPDCNEKKELMEKILLPAIHKILEAFEKGRSGKVNFYEFPLRALKTLSEREYKMNDVVLKGAYNV